MTDKHVGASQTFHHPFYSTLFLLIVIAEASMAPAAMVVVVSVLALVCISPSEAFVNNVQRLDRSRNVASQLRMSSTASISDMSAQMRDMRAAMRGDEKTARIFRAFEEGSTETTEATRWGRQVRRTYCLLSDSFISLKREQPQPVVVALFSRSA